MSDTIKLHEMKHIENTDGLVVHVMTGADEGLPLPPDGISVMSLGLEVDERWVLCWVRMPEVPEVRCADCEKPVYDDERDRQHDDCWPGVMSFVKEVTTELGWMGRGPRYKDREAFAKRVAELRERGLAVIAKAKAVPEVKS